MKIIHYNAMFSTNRSNICVVSKFYDLISIKNRYLLNLREQKNFFLVHFNKTIPNQGPFTVSSGAFTWSAVQG